MPKTFAQYNRWDKGLNSKFDELDVDRASLVECDHWDVSKPGKIRTVKRRLGSNIVENASSYDVGANANYLPLQHGAGSLLVTTDYDIDSDNQGELVAGGVTHLYHASEDGVVSVIQGVHGSTSDLENKIIYGTTASAHSAAMIWFEGILRVSDSFNHATGKTMWWGRISRTRFTDDDSWNTKAAWVSEQADLAAPVSTTTSANYGNGIVSLGALNTPVVKGGAPNLSIQMSTTSTTGKWQATSYEFGMSYTYEGNQESLIALCIMYDVSNAATLTYIDLDTQQHWSSIHVKAYNGNGANEDFAQRVTGCRFYIRKQGTGRRWRLFVDAHFSKGIRLNTFENFDYSWSNNAVGVNTTATIPQAKTPSVETYESLNGHSNSEDIIAFGEDQMTWGDATAINRRVFYTGVYYKDEDNNSKALHDRVFFSQPGKPDTVPVSNWVDLGINDGDVFVGLTSFANRILAFKKNTIYVMNVQNPSPMGWQLELVIENNGVNATNAICRTRYGVVWGNENGCYIWGGQGLPQELTTSIDVPDTWATDFSGCNITVGYDAVSAQIVVSKTALYSTSESSVDLSLCYIYDFATKSWIRSPAEMYWRHSNFMNTKDGELCWLSHTAGNAQNNHALRLSKWFTTTSNDNAITPTFTMKSDNFDSPGILKKFYSVLATIKTTGAADVKCLFNGGSEVTLAALNLSTPTVKRFTPSSPITAEKMQLTFDTTTSDTTGIEINDIALEYRQLRKRPDG